jgi:hypothetical protein
MSEWLRKNTMLCLIILIVVIVILAIVRILGGSTWAEWWGLQLINFGWFWGQRPFSYEHAGVLISFGVMAALIIVVVIIIYLMRGTFKAKGK